MEKVFHVKGDQEKSGVLSYNMPFTSIVTLRETQRNIIYLFLKCQYAEKMWDFYIYKQQMTGFTLWMWVLRAERRWGSLPS